MLFSKASFPPPLLDVIYSMVMKCVCSQDLTPPNISQLRLYRLSTLSLLTYSLTTVNKICYCQYNYKIYLGNFVQEDFVGCDGD